MTAGPVRRLRPIAPVASTTTSGESARTDSAVASTPVLMCTP
jgi:hypothetical protein